MSKGQKKIADLTKMKRLNELENSESGRVITVYANGNLKRRLRDIGIVKGATVKRLWQSPLGDPVSYLIYGSVFALRNSDAHLIEVDI